jgi:probable rRNA maturation factor
MNTVEISSEGIDPPSWLPALEKFVHTTLGILDCDTWEVSILLCDTDRIRELNHTYRGKDEATDVLSFGQNDPDQDPTVPFPSLPETHILFGDIVISPDMVKKNAEEFGAPFEQEMRRVVVHGLLHLKGMSHSTNDPDEPMIQLQERIVLNTTGETLF